MRSDLIRDCAITLRYLQGETQSEIAIYYNLTKNRIRQIVAVTCALIMNRRISSFVDRLHLEKHRPDLAKQRYPVSVSEEFFYQLFLFDCRTDPNVRKMYTNSIVAAFGEFEIHSYVIAKHDKYLAKAISPELFTLNFNMAERFTEEKANRVMRALRVTNSCKIIKVKK